MEGLKRKIISTVNNMPGVQVAELLGIHNKEVYYLKKGHSVRIDLDKLLYFIEKYVPDAGEL